ncbi:MAG TPA: YbhB/YbcL family Raf kinase inhibitor-like protein [Pirellulales bacterium]|nr:YbhB/YbcL family Raf kinase inhibitor-like protein [Pirellulales bacterium]
MAIELASDAFTQHTEIRRKYTGDGQDVSPPLRWRNVPSDVKEYALVCDDPDAPSAEPWVHWVLYKISAEVDELPEDLPSDAQLKIPQGALQGLNSWPSGHNVGYRGPAPPRGHGTHHYHFRIYALDAPLKLPPKCDKAALLATMQGHILDEGELIGTYQR